MIIAWVPYEGQFLMDSTTGRIGIEQNKIIKIFSIAAVGIEQNKIIKIFSIAAVVFLPPTLIASIYGMNFRFMPELCKLAEMPKPTEEFED